MAMSRAVSAYLHEGCQDSQAIRCTLGYVVALVFRVVVNDVNLWEQQRGKSREVPIDFNCFWLLSKEQKSEKRSA